MKGGTYTKTLAKIQVRGIFRIRDIRRNVLPKLIEICMETSCWCSPGALSIQQKFRFEIQEILRVQWNGSFRLHRPDPSHRALGYCSCKQDTKEWYWGQQFCQMERDISVRPTEMTRPVKEDHLQSWSRIFRSDQTEMVRSI